MPDDRPIYLLDFRPQFSGTDTDRLLLTTRSVDEIERLIRPVLEDHGLLLGEGVEVFFLRLLRSLSGRLALKLLSAPSHVSEALGLALARLFWSSMTCWKIASCSPGRPRNLLLRRARTTYCRRNPRCGVATAPDPADPSRTLHSRWLRSSAALGRLGATWPSTGIEAKIAEQSRGAAAAKRSPPRAVDRLTARSKSKS
jgi:hypothetical protein